MTIPAVAIELGGKEFKLRLGMNELAELEENYGLKIADFQDPTTMTSAVTIRAIFFVALKKDHPELTKDEVGEMLNGADWAVLTKKLLMTLNNTFGGSTKLKVAPEGGAEGNEDQAESER
jgi:hypothetical protein